MEPQSTAPIEAASSSEFVSQQETVKEPSVAGPSNNESQRPIFKCMFVDYGCEAVLSSRQDVLNHRDVCIYGILHGCYEPECDVKRVFEYPETLIAHSRVRHGLIVEQLMDNYFQINLSKTFCLARINDPPIKLIRYFKLNVGQREDVGVALMAIADRNGLGKPVIRFAAIITGREKDHFVRLIMSLRGKYGRQMKLQALTESESLSMDNGVEQMNNFASDCIAFQSPAQFIEHRYHAKMLQADGNELVMHGMHLSPNGPTLDVSARFFPFRCNIRVSEGKLKQPYASFWEDLDLGEKVRDTMSDGLYSLPSPYSSIILPQMRYQGNCDVIIESINERNCMNALITGMLDVCLENQGSDTSEPRFTKVLLLFPTVSQMDVYSECIGSRANHLGLKTRTLANGHRGERIEMMNHGTDIMLTTPTFLENAIINDKVWEIITSKLVHIHIHNPDRFTWDVPYGILRNFLSELNPWVHWLNTSAYTCHLTQDVERFLQNTLIVNGSSVISIGEDANDFLARMGEVKTYHYSPIERANRVVQIMDSFCGGRARKWMVIVKKMERRHLAPLKSVLDRPEFRGRVTYMSSETEVLQDRYNFFRRFNERANSILVGNSIALDLDEVKMSDGFILYDPAHHRTDATRVAMAALNMDGSFKPVFGIYTHLRRRRSLH